MGIFLFKTAAWSDFGLYWNNWKGIKQEDQQEDLYLRQHIKSNIYLCTRIQA